MEQSLSGKIIIAIIVTVILGFGGFIGFVFTSLMGGVKFYTPLVVILTIALIAFFNMKLFGLLKRKVLLISFASFTSVCLVAVISYEIYQSYHNSFEVVGDAEVKLYEYMPFHESSKVVKLADEASLKLTDNLPRLDGATALYPVYSAFVQATYPERDYDPYYSPVMSTKTGEAYNRLFHGEVDIIFVAAPSKKQLEQAEQMGVELELTPIGREAFVFFVNSSNPVEDLTLEDIQGIYSGQVTNWSELGGNNERIRAFQRPEGSGSQTALQNIMGDIALIEAPTEDVVAGMGGIIEQTASYRNYKNAIGYSFRYFSTEMVQNGGIRHLKINGVPPTKETIRSGEYPIASEFYAITAGNDNPNVEPFLEWILSEQGQYLIEETGYVSVNGGYDR